MIGIIGRKLGMTQIFAENGEQVPCTVIEAEPNPVVAVTDKATAGIAAVQLGYGRQRTARDGAEGEPVKVTGTTKGRGFQGVVKRHGFGGGPNTHGNTRHRKPGSVGPGTDPSRVIKGKRMPGHYGAERHTQIGLRVEKVDAERNLIYVRGSVAGPKNGLVLVQKQA